MVHSTKLALAVTGTLATAFGIGALIMFGGEAEAAPAANEATEPAVNQTEPQPMVSSFVPLSAVPAPTAPVAAITYPNGGAFPALNGVTRAVKIIWPSGRPYSPIIGKMNDGPPEFLEWYVHADGSHSTTAMRQVRRGGPLEPLGIVRSPVAVAPKLLRPDKDKQDKDR